MKLSISVNLPLTAFLNYYIGIIVHILKSLLNYISIDIGMQKNSWPQDNTMLSRDTDQRNVWTPVQIPIVNPIVWTGFKPDWRLFQGIKHLNFHQ